MAFTHQQKLSTESNDTINATLLCNQCCGPLNTSGFCPISCLVICPKVCHRPYIDAIPPPEYSTFNGIDSPPPLNSKSISLLLTTFVALTLTILLIGAYVVFKYFRRRSSTRRTVVHSQRVTPPPDDEEFLEQGPVLDHPIWYIRTVGLPPSLISKISVCKYKSGDGLIEGTECSVCLTEFEEDETLRLLPKCSHAFHVPCIDTWLRSHTNCPNCRSPIATNMGRSPSPEPRTGNSVSSLEVIGLEDDAPSREIEHISQSVIVVTEVEVEAEESEEDRSRNAHIVEGVKNSMLLQPIRRSVSVDSLSATKISVAIADSLKISVLGDEIEQEKIKLGEEARFMDPNSSSSSIGSASCIKRSLSLSGRFFLSKYSISRNSVLPR